ncbi:MAG TPA: Hpt domain-containing protein, partial [Acidobacteriota bacterium]|nr:Hpt domain-containing protein [Acidobacteriota bacterium]
PAPAAVAEPEPDAGAIDAKQIAQLREIPGRTHPQLLVELVELFRVTAPELLRDLAQAVTASDTAKTELLAHRLAGSCAHFGAFAMRTVALALERAAHDGDWAAASVEFEHLQEEWKRVELALSRLVP